MTPAEAMQTCLKALTTDLTTDEQLRVLDHLKRFLAPDQLKPVRATPRRKSAASDESDVERADVDRVLAKLSKETGVGYGVNKSHRLLVLARLRDGVSADDLRKVIVYCAYELGDGGWLASDKMRGYLRPETLFGPQTITRYLEPARAAWLASRQDAIAVAVEQRGKPDDLGKDEPEWWGKTS